MATVQVPFESGGAEVLVRDVCRALRDEGHQVDVVALPWSCTQIDQVMDQLTAFRILELEGGSRPPVDRLVAMKFPAYLIRHPRKVVWMMHQQRQAYELWRDPLGLSEVAGGRQIREVVRRSDHLALSEARRVLTISPTVSARLRDYCGIESEALSPPPYSAERFYCAEAEDYFLFPSRLSPWKRQGLAVEALARTRKPVRLRFAGFALDDPQWHALERQAEELGVMDRVEALGFVDDNALLSSYAHALAVLFPPQEEDYGYVTVEAMLASKAVITCEDSGGPLEWIEHGTHGWVAAPDAEGLALALDEAWTDRNETRRRGEAGRRRYLASAASWPTIVERLLS